MKVVRLITLLLCCVVAQFTMSQSNNMITPENIADIQPISKITLDESGLMYPSADGHYVLVGQHVWDLETGEKLVTLEGSFQEYDNDMIFSPDNRFFVTRQDNVIQLRETLTGEIRLVSPAQAGIAQSHSFSPDGRWLALNLYDFGDSSFIIWNLETLERDFTVPQPYVTSVLFHPTEPVLAAGTENGQVIMWRIAEGEEPIPSNSINVQDTAVSDIGFTRDGLYIMASVWEVGVALGPTIIADFQSGELHYQSAPSSQDIFLSRYTNTLVRLSDSSGEPDVYWDVATEEIRGEISDLDYEFSIFSFNPDESLLLAPDAEDVVVWQVDGGQEVYRLTDQYGAYFTAQGEQIIAYNDSSLTVWALPESE
jgi:WD40 repeat protein